jgi:hypothetical protein
MEMIDSDSSRLWQHRTLPLAPRSFPAEQLSRPLTIRLSIAMPPQGVNLYTPQGSMRWGTSLFELNPPAESPCDFWVVHSYSAEIETARVAPANTLFINGEPPAKKRYPRAFYNQYHHVVDSHPNTGHPRTILYAPCVGWHVGLDSFNNRFVFGYDHLKTLPPPPKQNRISVVCSNVAKTAGQRQRLAFLAALKHRLGDRVVHFGRGFTPVGDKLEVIAPFRYNLVLENSVHPHYWTEKLADAYLGWAFPVYSGCPNLGEYFPSDSFLAIDIRDQDAAIRTIENLLQRPEPPVLTGVAQARQLVLDHYNPFALCDQLARQLFIAAPPELVTVRNHRVFRPWRRFLSWFKRTQT